MSRHSERCLHCDHIRAQHSRMPYGCLGHLTPGYPASECSCKTFVEVENAEGVHATTNEEAQ